MIKGKEVPTNPIPIPVMSPERKGIMTMTSSMGIRKVINSVLMSTTARLSFIMPWKIMMAATNNKMERMLRS